MGAVPLTQGIYPKWASIKSNELEKEFHHLKNTDGTPQTLYFRRGL
jgi:hypothetical protein